MGWSEKVNAIDDFFAYHRDYLGGVFVAAG